jgi:predicted alpha-1,6-mannanase (GH76 family)
MVFPGTSYPAVAAGMAALQIFYNNSTGLWNTSKWWQAANALETTIDYAMVTNTDIYHEKIRNTFEKHKGTKFLDPWFYDDDGWWALAWIKAYDLTGETRYLDMAKTIFNHMKKGWDSTCGGGIWWKKRRTYKNAITNELFMTIAARLHLRTPGDKGPGSYRDWAQRSWKWFKNSGMINSSNLINDGLNDSCKNNGQTTWTYNQGVILGGLVDLYKITNDSSLLTQAQLIADAAINKLAPNGILREPCEPSDCEPDGQQFKGIFMRNLYYLYQTTNKPAYKDFIIQNANSILSSNRNSKNQFGLKWTGPFDKADAARQSSALDAINAAIGVSREKITYQAEKSTLDGVSTKTINKGYYGTGYVANWNRNNQGVTFNINVKYSGKYDLVFRYAAARGNASRYIQIGKKIFSNQVFPGTSSWNRWNIVTLSDVSLKAGSNTVFVSFDSGKGSKNWLHLDQMTVK